jgi:SAM-dependent MidA family methyltransferase
VNGHSAEKQVRPLGPLGEELRHRISTTGPMSFEGFMRLALYHPTDGYYATRVPGHGADYRTSPSISPWFGRLVGGALRHMWKDLGRPDPFWVIEVGAGLGDLAAGAMEAAGPMAGALRWRFVEQFDRVAGWQRRRLGSAAGRAEWTSELGEASPVCGCILANEVLDAFPVHVLEIAGDGDAREVLVGLDGDRFVETLGPLSTASLEAASRGTAACLGVGSRFEVCLELEEWFAQASRALELGYLLVIDYGDFEPGLWLRQPRGTVESPGPAGTGPSPLEEPGRKDITARVNFSAVLRAARKAGFRPRPLVSQRDWLRSLGLPDVAAELDAARARAARQGWVEDAVALGQEYDDLLELCSEGELGDLLVLEAIKAGT